MRGTPIAVLALVAASLSTAPLNAKNETARITIKGSALASPVEITDPQVREFQVWSGPGVSVNGVEQTEGFIIDWGQGAVAAHPGGLRHVEVSFYATLTASEPMYVVSYEYDPATGRGYVYLPGKGEEGYLRNTGSIYHGAAWEGHWFRATPAWEAFVKPIIARARAAALSSRVLFQY